MAGHKYAVQRFYDMKNGIAGAGNTEWTGTQPDSGGIAPIYLGKVSEALHIHQQTSPMNLDCGLHINPIWNPILDYPSLPETTYPLSSPDYL